MSEPWEPEQLLAPISEAQPCGEDLEYSELLASFDNYRLFGQPTSLDVQPVPPAPDDGGERREVPKIEKPREWPIIRDAAAAALGKSKDFRLLAALATALLRTNGIPAFCQTLGVAAQWLETYWAQVFPRIDDDAMMRRNALNSLADPMAIVDGLRRAPMVRSRAHGVYSLRDIDLVARLQTPSASDRAIEEPQLKAAFAATPKAELDALLQHVVDALGAVKRIDGAMRDAGGPEAAPDLGAVQTQLARLQQALKVQIAAHPEATSADAVEETAGSVAAGGSEPMRVGAIGSRDDAVRALEAVAEFFRRTEPSSPIPLFVMRAKRLVAKDFLEVLADVVPEAVSNAKLAGGVREDEV